MDWGKKLIIGLALFMIFIIGLGTIMIIRSESDTLIENDYYEKGQTYDDEYHAKQDAVNDMVIPVITTNEYGVTITFPVPAEYQLICRRSSDYRMDRIFNGSTDKDCSIRIMKGKLPPGPWLLKIEFTTNYKNYLFEGEVMMP